MRLPFRHAGFQRETEQFRKLSAAGSEVAVECPAFRDAPCDA